MDTKTALGAAGGISLTVVGAVSAIALTLGAGSATADKPLPIAPAIEYVDQYGNPIELDQTVAAVVPEIVVITGAPGFVDPDVSVLAAPESGETSYTATDYEEEAYEEDEGYEEHEDEDGDHEEDDDD
jgi:hypothetical protein